MRIPPQAENTANNLKNVTNDRKVAKSYRFAVVVKLEVAQQIIPEEYARMIQGSFAASEAAGEDAFAVGDVAEDGVAFETAC